MPKAVSTTRHSREDLRPAFVPATPSHCSRISFPLFKRRPGTNLSTGRGSRAQWAVNPGQIPVLEQCPPRAKEGPTTSDQDGEGRETTKVPPQSVSSAALFEA